MSDDVVTDEERAEMEIIQELGGKIFNSITDKHTYGQALIALDLVLMDTHIKAMRAREKGSEDFDVKEALGGWIVRYAESLLAIWESGEEIIT